MNRDARAALLAALREVYDGSWTRHVGTDGGQRSPGRARSDSSAAVTPTIDRHHAVMGAMGERFAALPAPRGRRRRAGARGARARRPRARDARRARRRRRRAVLAADSRRRRATATTRADRLIALATLVVRARSAVERDGYTREIELVPGSEAPTRLVIVLDRLLAGLDAIGLRPRRRVAHRHARWRSTACRRSAWRVLERSSRVEKLDTNELATIVRHPAAPPAARSRT